MCLAAYRHVNAVTVLEFEAANYLLCEIVASRFYCVWIRLGYNRVIFFFFDRLIGWKLDDTCRQYTQHVVVLRLFFIFYISYFGYRLRRGTRNEQAESEELIVQPATSHLLSRVTACTEATQSVSVACVCDGETCVTMRTQSIWNIFHFSFWWSVLGVGLCLLEFIGEKIQFIPLVLKFECRMQVELWWSNRSVLKKFCRCLQHFGCRLVSVGVATFKQFIAMSDEYSDRDNEDVVSRFITFSLFVLQINNNIFDRRIRASDDVQCAA